MREVWLLTFIEAEIKISTVNTKEAVPTDSRGGLLEAVSKHRTQIMGFAAMWIFIFHVRNEVPVFRGIPVLSVIDIYCVNIGFCGVDIFMFLSGWGLFHAFNKHSLGGFYKRRFRRLVLPLVVEAVAMAVYGKWGVLRFVKAITGWTFLTKNVHDLLWFIPAIAILYLLFPLYRKAFDKASNKYIFTAAVIALWFAAAFAGSLLFDRKDIYLFINRIPVFVTGILAGWLTYNGKKDLSQWTKIVLIVMLVCGVFLQYYVAFKKMPFILQEPRSGFPAYLIGIPVCFAAGIVLRMLDRVTVIQKALTFMGKISLEFYAAQSIYIRILKETIYYSGVPFDDHLYVLVVFALSLGTGYVLYLITTVVSRKMDGEPVFADTRK